jgi:hypothetical protein
MRTLLPLLFATTLLQGCAYEIDSVPARADFERPLDEVLADHPQFASQFHENRKALSEHYRGMVYAEPFREAYGEPDSWRLSWWNLFPFNWPIAPQTLWFWEIEGRTLQARVDHPFYLGFKPIVCDLEWVEPRG